MATSKALVSIVEALVPQTRRDEELRTELLQQSKEILSSHIGSRDTNLPNVADTIKRHLQHSHTDLTATLRFSNLLTRLVELPLLSRKEAALRLFYGLATSATSDSSKPIALFLPSLGEPPPFRSKTPLTPLVEQSSDEPTKKQLKSKAQLLKEYRKQINDRRIPEEALLRDCLYILQGISGNYIRLVQAGDDQRVVFTESEYNIPQPTRTLIHRLAEAGHLYNRVVGFVKSVSERSDAGMIEQSLAHHLQRQLTEYYRLVAVLETRLSFPADAVSPEAQESGLTLQRLEVWIDDWRLRLRMMSVSVEACKKAQGGALVSLIHGYTDNGDPFVRKFTDALLEDVSKPFFASLQKWLFGGELHDPFSEFFVAMNLDLPTSARVKQPGLMDLPGSDDYGDDDADDLIRPDDDGGRKLWQDQYTFRKEMLPSFVDEAFGKKIFSTGKSLNFIRYSCHDSDWVATRNEIGDAGRALRYSDIPGLERSIDAAYKVASQRLLSVFFDKFHLLDHFLALKHYLMLGYGDFADQLMEALGPSLSRPANTLYRHTLTAILEASIRASNAQNDPMHVLRRLDARMLEYSHGEIGWDVFTLEYKVDAPIDTVLDPDSMVNYMKVFNCLWKLKRIEVTLSQGWMRVAGGSRTFLKLPELQAEWHRVRVAMSEMIHFTRQLQAWCQLEVIECSWKIFQEFISRKQGDLDTLIEAHQTYLNRINSKLHFRSSRVGREDQVLLQAQELFQIIVQFRDAMDNFYNASLAEAARMDAQLDAARGVVTTQVGSNHSENLSRIIRRVNGYASSFSEKMQAMVHNLQSHTDTDCRFLAIRLSFSDYYKSKSRV